MKLWVNFCFFVRYIVTNVCGIKKKLKPNTFEGTNNWGPDVVGVKVVDSEEVYWCLPVDEELEPVAPELVVNLDEKPLLPDSASSRTIGIARCVFKRETTQHPKIAKKNKIEVTNQY